MILLVLAILFRLCTHCAALNIDSFYLFSNQTLDVLNINAITDEGTAESKTDCAATCGIRGDCEAFSFADTELKCTKILYTSNILFQLAFGVGGGLPEIFTRSNAREKDIFVDVWTPRGDYTYNTALKFWYRVVMSPKAKATDANDACKEDGAYLMLIGHQADYDFVINIQNQFGKSSMYLQGTRQTRNNGFADELGRPLTFYQWDVDGLSGGGLYLRTNTDYDMETSYGYSEKRYICQVILN